jgi:hypothetical protein
MKDHFVTPNIFNLGPESALGKTKGKWDAINTCIFLHQFDPDEQILICKSMLKLLKEKGGIIIGAQSASTLTEKEEIAAPFWKEGVVKRVWRHSKESFRRIWEESVKSERKELRV